MLRGACGELTGGCLQRRENGKRWSQLSSVGALLTEGAMPELEKPSHVPPFTGDHMLVVRARVFDYRLLVVVVFSL